MDLVALADVSQSGEHLGGARGFREDGRRVVGRGPGRCPTGEAHRVLPNGGIGVTRRDQPRGADVATVDRGVTPRQGPPIRARVRARRGDARGERHRLSNGRAEVGSSIHGRSGRRWRWAVARFTRRGPYGRGESQSHSQSALISHVVLSGWIKASASRVSGGAGKRRRPTTQAPMVESVRPMIRTSECSDAWRTYTTSSATLSGSRRSTYAVSASPPASTASPCV